MRVTLQNPPYLLNPGSFRLTATVLTQEDVLQAVTTPPPALPPPPPPAPIPVPPLPPPNPPSPLLILDTAQDVTARLPALKTASYGTVIRYLTTNTASEKCIKPAEAKAIAAAGMRLGLVFEIWGGFDNFAHGDINLSTGAEHGAFARQYAPTVGSPAGAIICFAIDTDVTSTQNASLVFPYFRAAKAALVGQYRIGAYACGLVCQTLLDAGIIDAAWLAAPTSWNGSRAFAATNRWVLKQGLPQTIAGLDADPNSWIPGGDIGDFVPFATTSAPQPAPIPLPAPAPAQAGVAAAPAFTQDGYATWYNDQTNADPAWPNVNNATDMTAAHNTLAFGTPVRVTRTDTAANVIVTIHDRGGPALTGSRIIDLRPAPATVLDMLDDGVVPVHIETISTVPAPAPVPPMPDPVPPTPLPAPLPPPPVINLPAVDADKLAAFTTALAQILNNAEVQAAIKALASGATATAPAAPSAGVSVLGFLGSFLGVWALPLAGIGFGVLSILQNQQIVPGPATVSTTTGATAAVVGLGLLPILKGAANFFGQLMTAMSAMAQPPASAGAGSQKPPGT